MANVRHERDEGKKLTRRGEIGNGRESRDNNVISTRQGNDGQYTLRRLARDGRDDLLDAIERQEIKLIISS